MFGPVIQRHEVLSLHSAMGMLAVINGGSMRSTLQQVLAGCPHHRL
jgi:hypothetical protein